jgi:hypothetical protein
MADLLAHVTHAFDRFVQVYTDEFGPAGAALVDFCARRVLGPEFSSRERLVAFYRDRANQLEKEAEEVLLAE